jgi:hypothetical protein
VIAERHYVFDDDSTVALRVGVDGSAIDFGSGPIQHIAHSLGLTELEKGMRATN